MHWMKSKNKADLDIDKNDIFENKMNRNVRLRLFIKSVDLKL